METTAFRQAMSLCSPFDLGPLMAKENLNKCLVRVTYRLWGGATQQCTSVDEW